MALQVWLPLNGDLHNQGLSKITVTNNGATVDNNGKIGKCYKFNPDNSSSGQKYLTLNKSLSNILPTNGKSFSFACWIKITGNLYSNGFGLICANQYHETGVGLYIISGKKILIQMCYNGTEQEWIATKMTALQNNVWYHITYTYNEIGRQMTVYIDGVNVDSTTADNVWITRNENILIGKGTQGGWNYTLPGFMNDVRIYDHCLSPKEVHEIAKGLVLHYKLDKLYSNTNLVTSLSSGGQTSISGNVVNITGNNSDTYFYINTSKAMTSGKTYKISCIGNFNNGVYYNFPIAGQTNTSPDLLKVQNGYCEMIFIANDACQNVGTRVILNDTTRNPGSGTITNIRLEEVNTIYDCSGYGNNGTILGTLSLNNDSPRYRKCTVFGTSHIYNANGGIPGASGSELTVSCWFYQTDRTGYQGLVGNRGAQGSANSASPLNWYLYTHSTDGSIQFHGSAQNKSTIIPSLNTWHHVVAVVKSSNKYDLYLDGEKVISDVSYTWGSTTQRTIISGYGGNYETFKGKISDVRIYATALSEDDIKDLYNTPTFIDNQGDLLTRELSEGEDNHQILKNGLTKINNFIETNNKFKVLSDGSVFLQILHHNNPTSNLFTSTNCWLNNTSNLYSSIILLKTIFKDFTEYEFLVCEKLTSSVSESQIRWKQTSNPATTTTSTGYQLISGSSSYLSHGSGGLVADTGHGCFDMVGGEWWCCCGCYTAYNGGIPGFTGTVTSGYLDLYIRIPQDILKGNMDEILRFFSKSILSNQFIEI